MNVFDIPEPIAIEIAQKATGRAFPHFHSWKVEERPWGLSIYREHISGQQIVTVRIRLDCDIDIVERTKWPKPNKRNLKFHNQQEVHRLMYVMGVEPDLGKISDVLRQFKDTP